MDDETETSTMVTVMLLASKTIWRHHQKWRQGYNSYAEQISPSRPKMATLRTSYLNDWPLAVPWDLGFKEGSHHSLAG